MKVGFVGLGHMGSGMAASLLKAGHEVIVYNRTPAKAEPLIAQGARAVASIADACRESAVITMLANDNAVEGVVLGNLWAAGRRSRRSALRYHGRTRGRDRRGNSSLRCDRTENFRCLRDPEGR